MTNDLTVIQTFGCAQWHALHGFIQRRGYDCHEAEDLTQEFLARLLGRRIRIDLRWTAGQCRAYLMKALRNFLANDWERRQCQKRGGRCRVVSLETLSAEQYSDALAASEDPEIHCDRQWALRLLQRVLDRLGAENAAAGKRELFDRLRCCLPGAEGECDYTELSETLHLSVPAVKMAAHRLRRRYGELLRAEIAAAVSQTEDIEREVRDLVVSTCWGWN